MSRCSPSVCRFPNGRVGSSKVCVPRWEPPPNRNLLVFWTVKTHPGSPMLQEMLMTRHSRTTIWVRSINALGLYELGAAGPSDPTATSQVDSLVFSISSLAAAINASVPKKNTHKAILHKCLVEAYIRSNANPKQLFGLIEGLSLAVPPSAPVLHSGMTNREARGTKKLYMRAIPKHRQNV